MNTHYKFVDFGQEFVFQGTTYVKCSHNRGRTNTHPVTFRQFDKLDIVEADIPDTFLNSIYKVG